MNQRSLFAQQLRDWRTKNGKHGRVTQEELADLLDVSVDAIGKYERSVSYIRGDLEHRLVERLGWDPDQVVACREDWQIRRPVEAMNKYRILGQSAVDEFFEGSFDAAIDRMMRFSGKEFAELPDAFAASDEVFRPIYEAYTDQWSAVISGDKFVSKWAVLLIQPQTEQAFNDGEFTDSALSLDSIHAPIVPGTYFGYCPAVIVRPGHEASATLLLSSFVSFLENLARRGILLHGIGTTSVTSKGAQLCRDLKMVSLGKHTRYPEFENWLLSGKAIAESLFARRSKIIQMEYAQAFGTD